MIDPTQIYVFGCFKGPGHRFFPVRGTLAALPLDVVRACDGLLRGGRGEEPEGQIVQAWQRVTPIPAGWSFVSWWDRQADPRRGSHTGVLAAGTWSDDDLLDAGRRLAPWAFRVEVQGSHP